MRIASLHPAATEIVFHLGLLDQLVGISADSDWPPEVKQLPVLNTIDFDTPRMTSSEIDAAFSLSGTAHRGASIYHVDADRLRALRPDLILTQEVCDVCAVSRQDVDEAARLLGYAPTILSLSPVNLDQVLEDVLLVARATDVRERGQRLVGELRARVERVRERANGLPRPRVFCMEWLDPPYSAGHWVPEMVTIAGGIEELGQANGYSRRITWEEVVAYQPEAIVLMPCSLSLDRVAAELPLLRAYPDWESLPAVRSRAVYAGETHLFSESGPRLVDGLETLARMLHPDTFSDLLPPGRALVLSHDGERLISLN